MTTPSIRQAVAVTAILGLLLLAGGYVRAQPHYFAPASSGKNVNNTTNCFYELYGEERNYYCGGADYWSFPLSLDFANYSGVYLTPSIEVYAPSPSQTIGCYSYVASGGTLYYQSNTVYPSQFNTVQFLQPTGTYIVNNPNSPYFAQVICIVYPNAAVYGISY